MLDFMFFHYKFHYKTRIGKNQKLRKFLGFCLEANDAHCYKISLT